MSSDDDTYQNTFYELANIFGEMNHGSSGETLSAFFGSNGSLASGNIRAIRKKFEACERELMGSRISYERLVEYLEVIRRYSDSFDAETLQQNSSLFIKSFKPDRKSEMLKVMGDFVLHASHGQTQVSLERASLLQDTIKLSEELLSSKCSDLVKEIAGLGLRSVKAMLSADALFNDEALRNEIRKIFMDYAASAEAVQKNDQKFKEKLVEYVKKYGMNSMGYVALGNDAVTNAQLLIDLVGN